jgi:hypothetical protein
MNKIWKVIFYLLLTFFILHFVRDLLQIFDVNTPLATTLQTNHKWCRPFCDYATLPHELFGIIATVLVLKRNRLGILGLLILLSLPLWTIGFMMEFLGLNS